MFVVGGIVRISGLSINGCCNYELHYLRLG